MPGFNQNTLQNKLSAARTAAQMFISLTDPISGESEMTSGSQRSSKSKKKGKSWSGQPREFMATISGRNPQSQSGGGQTAFSVSVNAITGNAQQAQRAQKLLTQALRESGIGGRPYVKEVDL